jgi:hypothetical protein
MQRRVSIGTLGRALTAAAIALAIASCSDAPTETAAAAGADPRASAKPSTGAKKAVLHTARVRGDGTLVDGTALSAVRLSEGFYRLTFPPPIGHCAAAANSAAFQGFDGSVFRIVAQIGIGVGQGGVFDDVSVTVNLFTSTDGSSEDSSFSLVLVCP